MSPVSHSCIFPHPLQLRRPSPLAKKSVSQIRSKRLVAGIHLQCCDIDFSLPSRSAGLFSCRITINKVNDFVRTQVIALPHCDQWKPTKISLRSDWLSKLFTRIFIHFTSFHFLFSSCLMWRSENFAIKAYLNFLPWSAVWTTDGFQMSC